ncbi:TetR/AcrR family transcriptional regulator [Steroidobacter agaridevorans]|uniref:TetR/AcrR family transcriptional regulator n=1 Tax=Steroidobacter agaridevorans TaxID=2695856 RepID=UPI00137AA395|nr:TetR/AcrR family transcriptional regulator [Steroidobacter agaridevorans]
MSTIPSIRARAAGLRRQQLLDAAAALVLKRGTAALTLDAVAEAAHVSKGGLLYYFDSKNSLLEALADYLAEQLQIEVEREAAGGSLAKAYLQVVSRMGQLPKDQQVFKALTIICTAQPELAGRVRARLHLSPSDNLSGETPLEELHLRLVADGMWLADLFSCYEISPEQRAALLQKLGAA